MGGKPGLGGVVQGSNRRQVQTQAMKTQPHIPPAPHSHTALDSLLDVPHIYIVLDDVMCLTIIQLMTVCMAKYTDSHTTPTVCTACLIGTLLFTVCMAGLLPHLSVIQMTECMANLPAVLPSTLAMDSPHPTS
jgi:hypothetical protein